MLLALLVLALLVVQLQHGNAEKLGGKDSSAYMLKDNIVVLRGQVTLEANTSENVAQNKMKQTVFSIDFPEGFSFENTIVLAFGTRFKSDGTFSYGDTSGGNSPSAAAVTGDVPKSITVGYTESDSEKKVLRCQAWNISTVSKTLYYRIVLMKIPGYVEGVDYTLGDVNGDGQITEEDAKMCEKFSIGTVVLTEQQFKAADVDKNGEVDARDSLRIKKHINEGYEFE